MCRLWQVPMSAPATQIPLITLVSGLPSDMQKAKLKHESYTQNSDLLELDIPYCIDTLLTHCITTHKVLTHKTMTYCTDILDAIL